MIHTHTIENIIQIDTHQTPPNYETLYTHTCIYTNTGTSAHTSRTSTTPSLSLEIDIKQVATRIEPSLPSCNTLIQYALPSKEEEFDHFNEPPTIPAPPRSSGANTLARFFSNLAVNFTVNSTFVEVHLRSEGKPIHVSLPVYTYMYS
jgi:hypothetical protein